MNTSHILATAGVFIALTFTACSKSEPPPAPSEPARAPAASTTEHGGMDHSQMHGDCDTQGIDMSKMSEEEHKAMMEKCPQPVKQ